MNADLFAGISVSDLETAVAWYERLLGSGPSFRPNDVEAVWEVADHGYLYVEQRPDRAGHAMVTLFVGDLERRLTGAADPRCISGGGRDLRQRRAQGDLP
ncbi:MAG: hypothetical protein U0R78_13145 [Nocardioidaceae bacterium]